MHQWAQFDLAEGDEKSGREIIGQRVYALVEEPYPLFRSITG